MRQKLVTVFTRSLNARPYIEQCLDSVLSQTYTNFEYILLDNGSTDGASEIMRQYAGKDSRIQLIAYDTVRKFPTLGFAAKKARGEYLTVIDSDDWWEPDYLERLTSFLENNQLDLAVTGTINYYEPDGISRVMRKLDKPLVMTTEQFAKNYPRFWTFPSTYWGGIMKTSLLCQASQNMQNFSYGNDTINMLRYLEQCDRIGIDNSALYHYRIREKSVSSEYDENRFPSNVYFYNCVKDFLNKHNTFDADKQEWLKRVHANSIRMTAETLANSKLSADEKISELHKITEHSLTKAALTVNHPEIAQTRSTLLSIALKNADAAGESFGEILADVAPKCAPAVSPERAQLFALKPELAMALSKDDADAFLATLLDMIYANEQSKKFDLCAMVQALTADKPLLKDISDKRFLRRYGDIYLSVWRERYVEALDAMTGLLLNGEKADEVFLQLYLSLAALLNKPEAFVFGKVCQAKVHLRRGEKDSCRAVLDELAEMGVEENDEITAMRNQIR